MTSFSAIRKLLLLLGSFLMFAPTSHANIYDEGNNHVQTIEDLDEFTEKVIDGDGVWMIQFYTHDTPNLENLVKHYEVVAEITKGIYNVAAIDMKTEDGLPISQKYNIKHSPTVLMFGDDKENPIKFTGDQLTAQDLTQNFMEFAVQTMQTRADGGFTVPPPPKSGGSGGSRNSSSGSGSSGGGKSKVVQITSANFQSEVLDNPKVGMIAFTAPWCGHCKQLHPDWEAAARKLDGEDAFLGWVDATVETELASMFQVKSYPTIKLFPGGTDKSLNAATTYNGGRTITDIVSAVLAEVDKSGVPKPIPELISSTVLREECSGQNHICVLAALPHILDSGATGRNNYKDLISKVSKTFRGSAFSFLWFEGGSSQPQLEEALELTFGFPAIVALSMDRKAYVVMRSSFGEKQITTFLHGVTSGRQPTIKLRGELPTVVTTEPWDGKDGELVDEEELSLAEIMGWDEDEEKKEGESEL